MTIDELIRRAEKTVKNAGTLTLEGEVEVAKIAALVAIAKLMKPTYEEAMYERRSRK